MKFTFSDAFVSISGCTFQYTSGTLQTLTSSQFGCQANLHEIQISFNLASRLSAGVTYNFSFYGLDHGSASSQSVSFKIYDANFGYLIEQAYYSYYLEIADTDAIVINDIKYDYQNLDAISNLEIDFTIPRDMQANENLDIDIGPSLQGNNLNTNRLSLTMKDSFGSSINIIGSAKSQVITLQFKTGVLLPKGYYVLKINNIKTPSSQSSDEIQVKFRRSTDNVYVLGQLAGAYTPIPTLSLIASANITLVSTRYICVGCLGEITLQVTTSVAYIDYTTIFFVHFPSYFLPALTNNQNLMSCYMNSDPITCSTETEYPFRLKLNYPPTFYNPGGVFNITIYGFIVPNAGQSISNNEDLFFAISAENSKSYTEQSFVKLPQLLTPQSGTGTLFLYKTSYSSLYIKDTSDHSLRVNTTGTISNGSLLTATFTQEYNNLQYISTLSCAVSLHTTKDVLTGYAAKTCTVSGQTVFFSVLTTISKGSSIELIIYSVPNPTVAGLVDPNEFIIASYLSDGNTITAISSPGLNSADNVTFVQPSNTLSANNGSDITIVKGTFSDFIYLGTQDGTRFKQDVVISAKISGFTFIPGTIQFYVGDIGQNFRVGCEKNVKVRTYPLNFTQSEDNSLSNLYGSLFNLRINVISTPVVISVPYEINITEGASSIPIPITLVNPPYTDMQILITIDDQYFNGAFEIDYDYSSPSLSYSINETTRYLAFTTTSAISNFPSTFSVSLTLDGTNYESYTLEYSEIIINVLPGSIGNARITGTQSTIGKTFAKFTVTPNSEGIALIQISTCQKIKSIDVIKNYLRNNNYQDYESTTGDCWQRYFMKVYDQASIGYILEVDDLTPATKYYLTIYYENEAKANNVQNPLDFTFTTSRLNPILKMGAKFSSVIYIDQLNDLICFLLRLFQTRIINVVDAQGFSCSNYIEPTSSFLSYTGSVFSNFATEFNFYLLPDPTLENDASSLFVPLYLNPITGLATPAFNASITQEGIYYVSEFESLYYFTADDALYSNNQVKMPNINSVDISYQTVEGITSIIITNIDLDAVGSVYFIARQVAEIVQDPQDEYSTIQVTTRIASTPTSEQIYACQDWKSETADSCARAVIANNNPVTLYLRGLIPNSVYMVYYVAANEYPISPVLSTAVDYAEITVLSAYHITISGIMTMIFVLLHLLF